MDTSHSTLFFGLFILFYESHEGVLGNVADREIKEGVVLHKSDIRNRLHLEKGGKLRYYQIKFKLMEDTSGNY